MFLVVGVDIKEVQEVVETHLRDMILKHFDPKKADSIFSDEGAVSLSYHLSSPIPSYLSIAICRKSMLQFMQFVHWDFYNKQNKKIALASDSRYLEKGMHALMLILYRLFSCWSSTSC